MVRCMRKPVGTGHPPLVAGPAPLATPDSLTDFESFWVEMVRPARPLAFYRKLVPLVECRVELM